MKIETTSLMYGGAPRRRVLFAEESARVLNGSTERTRAGILKDAREWLTWAASLVQGTRDPEHMTPGDEQSDVEVR